MTEQQQDRLVFCTSTHWMKYLPKTLHSVILFLAGTVLLIIGYAVVRVSIVIAFFAIFVGIVLVLLAHHRFFHLLLSEAMQDIVITTKRILYFDDCLFFCDDEHEIPLWKVAAVEVKQHGLFQNVLDYGVLWFDTGGGAVDIKRSIPYVPHPDRVAETITGLLKQNE
jgi:hypothetical protein